MFRRLKNARRRWRDRQRRHVIEDELGKGEFSANPIHRKDKVAPPVGGGDPGMTPDKW
jgi:hypothetical protein